MSSAPSIFLRRLLAGGAVLGAAWWFHSHRVAPLQQREAECLKSLAEDRQRINDATAKIRRIGQQAPEAARVRSSLDLLQGGIPTEPTAVWLPVRMKAHLQRGGIADAVIRMNSALPEPGVAGYERSSWHLNLPRQDRMKNLNGVLLAVAEIESNEPFVRILDMSFRSDAEEPHSPAGGFNVTALVPK